MLTPYLWSQKLRAAWAGQSLAQGARVRWQLQAPNWPCQYWDWWNLQCQIKTWTTKKHSYHVYCIFLYHISHITYHFIIYGIMYLMYQYHHIYNQNIGTSPTSTVNSGDSVGGGGLSSMTPMELMQRGVGVPLCPGFLTSSWAATIHQDRASRTRAATGVRVGYLNWYNAAVDDVRCTCTEGFTYLCHIFQ